MSPPATGVPDLNFLSPNFDDDVSFLSHFAKTTNPDPPPTSKSKRRKSKPVRFEAYETEMQMEHPLPPKINVVVSDPSGACLSTVEKEKPTSKRIKTMVLRSYAMGRAMEVQSSLGNEFPSCIKTMVKSQVSCGFWMGLPLHFCKSYLPKEDATIVLEDENGEQWDVKYIAYKFGLSKGWRQFVGRHNLMEGDVLLFHLVETTRLKVYIFKANDTNEVIDVVPASHLNLEAHSDEITPVTSSPETENNRQQESRSLTVVQKQVEKPQKLTQSARSIAPSGRLIEHLGNDSEEGGSEVLECSRPSNPNFCFQGVKSFEDFHILVNGLCIDCELPEHVRTGYFKLCLYKKQFLHDGLPEGLYEKLVAGMIGQTVSIANEIKNCKLTTSKEAFETWDNSLKSFELLGMDVGFLREKIHAITTLISESESSLDVKRYTEVESEHERVKDQIKRVAATLKELKEGAKKLEGLLDILKQKIEKYEFKFKEEVSALW